MKNLSGAYTVREESALFVYMARALIKSLGPGQTVTIKRDLADGDLDDTQHLFVLPGFEAGVVAKCEPNYIIFERLV